MGLLERIREVAGCAYISDLVRDGYNDKARRALRKIDISEYSLSELADAAEYIFSEKVSFGSESEAKEFFLKHR